MMTNPCCGECAEMNPSGCPGDSPYCIPHEQVVYAAAEERLQACALAYSLTPSPHVWREFLDAADAMRDAWHALDRLGAA